MYSDLKRQYGILNQRLDQPGQEWIGLPDRPSVADISIYPFADQTTLARMELDVAQWPALQRWQQKMSELEYVKKAYGEMGSRSICEIENDA
jgi:glutathione S-transferase